MGMEEKKTSGVVSSTINKGIPVNVEITLGCSDLEKLCDSPKKIQKIMRREFLKLSDFISSICEKTEDYEFFQTMEIIIDEETLEKKVCFSKFGLLNTLVFNLNMYSMIQNKTIQSYTSVYSNFSEWILENKEELNKRFSLLRNLKSERQLRREFPMLYDKYFQSLEIYENFKNINQFINDPKISPQKRFNTIKNFYENLGPRLSKYSIEQLMEKYSCSNLHEFGNRYADAFEDLICHSSKIFEYMKNNPLPLDNLTKMDQDRLELYVAYRYLYYAIVSQPVSTKQKYLYYVSNYFYEHADEINDNVVVNCGSYDSSFSEISSISGFEVTPKSLYNVYKELLLQYPELKVIHLNDMNFSNMTLEEVENFMNEYLKELSANWEFLPSSQESLERVIIHPNISSNSSLTEEEKKLKEEKLVELYIQKKEFFESSDPFYIIKGKNTFDGYIGYIYKNGKVFLERFYESTSPLKIASGQAIYVMNMDEFYQLSQYSKTQLIRDRLCKRFIHKGNWQERVLIELQKDNSNVDTVEVIKKLVKTNQVSGYDE